jgi:hypothetical protein
VLLTLVCTAYRLPPEIGLRHPPAQATKQLSYVAADVADAQRTDR